MCLSTYLGDPNHADFTSYHKVPIASHLDIIIFLIFLIDLDTHLD